MAKEAGGNLTQQVAWASGDFAAIGSSILLSAELLAEALDLRSGWQVLDVAAGHGNMSLAAARRGCRVRSTDFVPALLERGRVRADAEGWRITFEVADAERLPYANAAFDCVVSTFGVMFAPDQERAAAELMRVCRPAGKIGLASWTPTGFIGQLFAAIDRYAPAPAGSPAATLWGTEARLRELFGGIGDLAAVSRHSAMRAPSIAIWLDRFSTYFGPLQRTLAALEPGSRAALEAELVAVAKSLNRSGDGTMVVESEYLEVVMTR